MQSSAKQDPKGNENYGGASQCSKCCRNDALYAVCETTQVKHRGVANERGEGHDD